MDIKVEVTGAKELAERFENLPSAMRQVLFNAVKKEAFDLAAYVKSDKLSGQVLNRRTGRLSNSVNSAVVDIDRIVTGTVGTNVEYARIHEYGGIIWMIPRMQTMYHKTVHGYLEGGLVKKSESNFATDHAVAGYKITMPERSFLRSALADRAGGIRERLHAATVAAAAGETA